MTSKPTHLIRNDNIQSGATTCRCNSPDAPARWTRIRSTRRSTSPAATKSSCAQTALPCSPPVQKVYRFLKHQSSGQKVAASGVSSLFGHSSLRKLAAGHVSSTSGLQETGAVGQRICCNNAFSVYSREGKEIGTPTMCIR